MIIIDSVNEDEFEISQNKTDIQVDKEDIAEDDYELRCE